MSEPRRWEIRHYREFGRDEADARAEVLHLLRDMIRREGFALDDASVTSGEPVAIVLKPEGGYRVHTSGAWDPDGWITTWTATAHEPVRDDQTASAVAPLPGGGVRAEVPVAMQQTGGGLRVPHRLGGEVTVKAFRVTGEPIGYRFAQPVTDDEEHVELMPGTGYLTVTLDE